MDVLRLVVADATRRLAGALKTRKPKRVASAIQEIVEATVPVRLRGTSVRARAHPAAAGNPHRVWRWIARDGLSNLVVEALPDWQSLAVSAYVTRPGVTARAERVYRDVTDDPERLETLVLAAVRRLHDRDLG